MRTLLLKLKSWMTKLLEFLLIVAVGLLVIDVVWGVFTRYAMGQQANWTEELARFLLVWVTLLGGAVAFGTKGHLGVDYFVAKLHVDARKAMAIISHLIVLFFAVAIFLYGGGRVVSDALAMEQMTPALGWRMGYVYLALPISGVFIVLYTIENLVETIATPADKLGDSGDRDLGRGRPRIMGTVALILVAVFLLFLMVMDVPIAVAIALSTFVAILAEGSDPFGGRRRRIWLAGVNSFRPVGDSVLYSLRSFNGTWRNGHAD